jgi:hypothetical protein
MGKRIARESESQGVSLLSEDKGFAWADGHLSYEYLKSEFFQYGPSVIMVANARATTQKHQIGFVKEGFRKRLRETSAIIPDLPVPNWIRRIGEE